MMDDRDVPPSSSSSHSTSSSERVPLASFVLDFLVKGGATAGVAAGMALLSAVKKLASSIESAAALGVP